VERPLRVLREALAALVVVGERRAALLRGIVDLAQVQFRDLVGGRELQHLLEVAAGVGGPAGVVLVDGEVLEGRVEGRIDGEAARSARWPRPAFPRP
jgi:hypothetical protein